MSGRLIAMSRSGRHVAVRRRDGTQARPGLDAIDALGTAPRRALSEAAVDDVAFVGETAWWIEGASLCRRTLPELEAAAPIALAEPGALIPSAGEDDAGPLLIGGRPPRLVVSDGDAVALEALDLGDVDLVVPLGGRRILALARPEVLANLPGAGQAFAATALLGGRAIAIATRTDDGTAFDVIRPSGGLIHHVELPAAGAIAFADGRGVAIVATPDRTLHAIDLRYGRPLGEAAAPLAIDDLALDAGGRYVAIAAARAQGPLQVLHVPWNDLFGGVRPRRIAPAGDPTQQELGAGRVDPMIAPPIGDEPPTVEPAPATAAPADDGPPSDAPLAAFGAGVRRPVATGGARGRPYRSAREHLGDLMDLVAAWAARAIADAWDTGRLSLPADGGRPFQAEVEALIGARRGDAGALLEAADRRVEELGRQVGARSQATLAEGRSLPFLDVAAEFALSPIAVQVLAVAAGPALRGEIARLYGVLANDEGRPICDRYLIELILGGTDHALRAQVASELEPESPLVKYGVVRILPSPPDQYLFAGVTVEPVLMSRLRGQPHAGAGAGAVTTIRHADRPLDRLVLPPSLVRELIAALVPPTPPARPLRLILRGRPGSGRTSLAAALVERAGRHLAVVDCERLPRTGFGQALRVELGLALLRGAVPCVSGLELADSDDREALEQVRETLRGYPGPLIVRGSPEHRPPLDPGHLSFTLPALNEGERAAFWRAALARRGLRADGVDRLAARFRVGPGTIERILAQVVAVGGPDLAARDLSEELDRAARQHIDVRLAKVATQVDRLARWDQVALPDDTLDSIREFIGRVRHRRTVYEAWGFDRKVATSRGLVALFYGPPGTGKTMVAGLIARELGLDLFRVDLARITSKWIGETEKNLGEVFDAAEDGQALILFDEADSLFAKRTEVKSSVDRYANLEVNYLLQRLDSFEGIAILTTNLEGSIDQAFKRRLSLRLAFPFPDEDMRVRLWAAHIPSEVPTRDDFDFVDLARRFPMSGGYIRNSALRAAFLAAQEGAPLAQDHLQRAIALEYREMGKLSAGGRIE
jgi:hypothetical protein